MILWAITSMVTFIDWIGYEGFEGYGIFFLICVAPIVLGAVIFVMYFLKMDDPERKKRLEWACYLVTLSALLAFIIQLIMLIIEGEYIPFSTGVGQLINSIITGLVNLYYGQVCKRFAAIVRPV